MIIGVKTESLFKTYKVDHKYFMQITKQRWLLNSTKGWKRGAKTKKIEAINAYQFYPRIRTDIEWDRYA